VKTRRLASLAGAVAVATAVWASPASAATLIGDYQFQGTKASSGPGPDLGELVGPGGAGTYQQENVMGTTRQVFAFPEGTGLQRFPTGLGSATALHSVVMTFRLLDDTMDNRILDWSDGTSDSGIYDAGRFAYYYRPSQAIESDNAVFGSDTYSTLAVTAGNALGTRLFVNGPPVVQSPYQESIIGDAIRFFYDNTSGSFTGENSAGAVSCIRVFDGILTDAEIAAIGASPDCIAHPAAVQTPPAGVQTPPSPTAKRCKKHKRKHRSAESAKKKCKKKRKKR
jgi:hypothetical protein